MYTNQELRNMNDVERFSAIARQGINILRANVGMLAGDDIERGGADCGYRIERDAVNELEDDYSFRRCCWFVS